MFSGLFGCLGLIIVLSWCLVIYGCFVFCCCEFVCFVIQLLFDLVVCLWLGDFVLLLLGAFVCGDL